MNDLTLQNCLTYCETYLHFLKNDSGYYKGLKYSISNKAFFKNFSLYRSVNKWLKKGLCKKKFNAKTSMKKVAKCLSLGYKFLYPVRT